ncbi:TetR/AcrR family transcriptional regulator [Rhodococcus sp. NPDC003318]|uniref:TetR/AcrR family transcriptional regulator n=1 Tax=Rhodococcus sp. NPDC003318 TaxID=3364503 RepID=UPI003684C143
MAGNRERALDAAIEVLGTQGLRALTHRAVDTAAGLPQGSTSNWFRTRSALVDAVLVRLVEHDRGDWDRLGAARLPATLTELADGLTGYVRLATGEHRARTTARLVLFAAASTDPALVSPISSGRADLLEWGTMMLAMLGSPDPAGQSRMLTDYLDGVILHQLAAPAEQIDPRPGIVTLLAAFFGTERGRI